jgi:hypothetical protein
VLRIVVPGFLLLLGWHVLERSAGYAGVTVPTSLKDTASYWPVLLLGAVYYATPMRTWSNGAYLAQVQEQLRAGLVRISGRPDDPSVLTWDRIHPLFWSKVDSDKSLGHKAKLAYFNGLLWTSVADMRVIGTLYILFSGFLALLGFDVRTAVFIYGAAVLLSWPFSKGLTQTHLKIGRQQLEHFEFHYKEDVSDYVKRLEP